MLKVLECCFLRRCALTIAMTMVMFGVSRVDDYPLLMVRWRGLTRVEAGSDEISDRDRPGTPSTLDRIGQRPVFETAADRCWGDSTLTRSLLDSPGGTLSHFYLVPSLSECGRWVMGI